MQWKPKCQPGPPRAWALTNASIRSKKGGSPRSKRKTTIERKIVNPASLAKPTGYSNGMLAEGKVLALAGQTGMDATGRTTAPGNIVAQFARALANLEAVVTEAGGSMTDVVKLNIYVRDKNLCTANLKPIGEAYRSIFGKHYPAMTLADVKSLFDDESMLEAEGVAVIGEE